MNLQERKFGIGGSECAAALGLSKWKTPYQVWLDKLSEETNPIDNEHIWWGKELEPIVIKRYEQRTGNKVELLVDETGNQKTIINNKYPWLRAHVDGVVREKKLIIEAKTTRYFMDDWGDFGSDQIPTEYLIQCAHYCIVLNDLFEIEGVDIAVLGSTSDFRIYHYKRDPKLEEIIINKTKNFWYNHVATQTPPPPTKLDDLSKIYKTCKNNPIIADNDILNKCDILVNIKDKIKALEEEKVLLENEIKLFMKENNELIDVRGEVLATWNSSTSKIIDTKKLKASGLDLEKYYKESTKRTFLIKK